MVLEHIYFFLLCCTSLSLWVPFGFHVFKKKFSVWAVMVLGTSLFGLVYSYVNLIGLIVLGVFAGMFWFYRSNLVRGVFRFFLFVAILCFCIALFAHLIPGFDNPKFLFDILYSKDAIPYSKYLNLDKTVAGVVILGLGTLLIRSKRCFFLMIRKAFSTMLCLLIVVIALALGLGFIRFDPKLHSTFFLWAGGNLFLTCVSEEALFRAFIQKELCGFLRNDVYGLVIASLLFGLAHFAGGEKYVLLAFVAGLGYGFLYKFTGRIEASILGHFAVNLVHFLFFTYPAIK